MSMSTKCWSNVNVNQRLVKFCNQLYVAAGCADCKQIFGRMQGTAGRLERMENRFHCQVACHSSTNDAIPVCRCKKALDGGCPAKRMRPCSSPVVFRPASKSSMVLLPVPGSFASGAQSLNAAQSINSTSSCANKQLALSMSGRRTIQAESEGHRLLSLSNARG